jgi:hypothetical protein
MIDDVHDQISFVIVITVDHTHHSCYLILQYKAYHRKWIRSMNFNLKIKRKGMNDTNNDISAGLRKICAR